MSLHDYLRNGWIRSHETSRDEIRELLAIVERDLAQSQTPGLGPEWRFDIAYNAALQAATAALAATGHRAERQNKHARTIECLAFTVGLGPDAVAFLDTCRRKRHVAVYERVGAISEQEAADLLGFAKDLRERLTAWLARRHPELSP